ncbi:hypothetical protein EV174_000980 [Coemansia sp. RSA 2320]|nr:hypothetical protein EV174_000980 [Coemansia sp. RSA 2320]
MMATRDIEQGEAIVRVPDRLLVTASKAKAAVLSRAKARSPSFGSDWGLSEHQSLAYWVYAETELQEKSEWASYICSLPRDFASVPLFVLSGEAPSSTIDTTSSDGVRWVAAHLPQPLRQKVSEQQSRLFGDWSLTRASPAVAQSLPLTNWRLYVWSWLVASTRCIHLGRQGSIALAPLLDLLNHSETASISALYDTERGHFVIKTNRPFKRGQEVFISYGPHDNIFMLAEYGFVLACNPYQHLNLDHAVELWVAAAKARLLERRRAASASPADIDALVDVLRQRGLWGDFALSADDVEPPYRLQAALRLLLPAESRQEQRPNPKRAIAQWERWRRGEPEAAASSSALHSAVASWTRAACQGILSVSDRMIRDTSQHSAGLDAFLVHCLHTVWREISAIAACHCA